MGMTLDDTIYNVLYEIYLNVPKLTVGQTKEQGRKFTGKSYENELTLNCDMYLFMMKKGMAGQHIIFKLQSHKPLVGHEITRVRISLFCFCFELYVSGTYNLDIQLGTSQVQR